MGICPNCGSWIDDGDICHGCGGSGIYSSQDEEDEQYNHPVEKQEDTLGKRAWNLYLDNNYDDAIYYINSALNLNRFHSNNWNIKAIILEYIGKYEESEKCYNKSLELRPHNVVYENKARMLRNWADHLISESKNMKNGLAKLDKALETNRKAINSLPKNTKENIDNFLSQKHLIEMYIKYEKEYQKNIETLKTYDKSELFTITGRQFYNTGITLTSRMSLKLVKEPDNKFDKNAIAVYCEDKKIGYVANRKYTKFEQSLSASEMQDKFKNVAQGEYLFHLLKLTNPQYPDIQFDIGKLLL